MSSKTRTPEAKKLRTVRHRARKRGSITNFSIGDWQRALRYFNDCCAICGTAFGENQPATADHWIPISSGGRTDPQNIVPTCRNCNCNRMSTSVEEWLAAHYPPEEAQRTLERVQAYFREVARRPSKTTNQEFPNG